MNNNFVLKSLEGLHEGISLPSNVSVIIGRSKQTHIADIRCSRKHLELTANNDEKFVLVKSLSTYPCFVGDYELKKGDTAKLLPDMTLHIIGKEYPHYVCFEKDTGCKKRKHSEKVNDSNGKASNEDEIAKKLQKLQNTKFFGKISKSPISENFEDKVNFESRKLCNGAMIEYKSPQLKHSTRIAAFDMDGTIIVTKSGKTFPIDKHDWKLFHSKVQEKLKCLNSAGTKIVFITNQNGISKGHITENDFKGKMEAIIKRLNVPIQVLALIKKGIHRKPNTGAYEWLIKEGNGGLPVEEFFYVGDAAGREKGWGPGKKKDHSCSDRLFAINIGCPFSTPEEFFFGAKEVNYKLPDFDPRKLKTNKPLIKNIVGDLKLNEIILDKQEVVLMVGYPASGKSTFAKSHFKPAGYEIINQDKLKSKEKCIKACKSALLSGKSCVIDNTNPQAEIRKSYLILAKEANVRCRCFFFDIDISHVFHNNRFRELTGSDHAKVTPMVIYSYRKKLVKPEISEGFNAIITVNFIPNFSNQEHRILYNNFLD